MLDYSSQALSAQTQQRLGRPLSPRAYYLLLQRTAPLQDEAILSDLWGVIANKPEQLYIVTSEIEAALQQLPQWKDRLDLSPQRMALVIDGVTHTLDLDEDTWAGVLVGALPHLDRVQLILAPDTDRVPVPAEEILWDLRPYLTDTDKRYSATVEGVADKVRFDSSAFLQGLDSVKQWLQLPSPLYSQVTQGEVPLQAYLNFHDLFLYHHSEPPSATRDNTIYHDCTLLRDIGHMHKGDTFDVISIIAELYMWRGDEMVGDETVSL